MSPQNSLSPASLGCDFGYANHRCIGSQNGLWMAKPIQILKELLLQLQIFGDTLNDQVSIGGGLAQFGGGFDPVYGWLDFTL